MAGAQRKQRAASPLAQQVDAHVGRRIRDRRSELAVSRSQLATMLRISQEQVRRYEAGVAAIVASRLQEIGDVLGVPASHFFDGMSDSRQSEPESRTSRETGGRAIPTTRELKKMVDAYWEIVDPALRRQVLTLVLAVADSDSENGPTPTTKD
jgi:transcriptional regulator with XRE-family HTH domain